MRAGLLTLAVLAASTNAAPRKPRHHHLHAHERRADAVEVRNDVVVVTATAPAAVVYVDSNGNPISTSFQGQPTPVAQPYTGAGQPNPPVQSPAANSPQDLSPPAQPAAVSQPASDPAAETPAANVAEGYIAPDPAPASAPASNQDTGPEGANGARIMGHGASYTPYNADGSVKTQDQVTNDLAQLDGFSTIRIYGTDNNQTAMTIQAAKPKGMKVFAGIFDIDNVASETQTIIDEANNDWDSIHTISVGNEAVNNGKAPGSVVSAINTARGMLRAAGYTGPVVAVDTFVAMIAHPEICQNSDYPAANIHPFFDQNTDADSAAEFVQKQVQNVAAACGKNDVVVTESGWPWKGSNNGPAVPGPEQQSIVISGLKSKFPNNIVLFSPYDDSWKADGAFGCEKYWGFLSHDPS